MNGHMTSGTDDVKPDGVEKSDSDARMAIQLPKTRYRLLLEQFASEYGDGWMSEIARKLGMTPGAIQKQWASQRGASLQTITMAMDRLGIAREFFFDPALGDQPHYRDHLAKTRRQPTPPNAPNNVHWRRFSEHGYPARMGLTDEQTAWIQVAPFRGGAQSIDDYIAAAEVLLHLRLSEPPEAAEARRDAEGEPPYDPAGKKNR